MSDISRKEDARKALIEVMELIAPPGYELRSHLDDSIEVGALGYFTPTNPAAKDARTITFSLEQGDVEFLVATAFVNRLGVWDKDERFGAGGVLQRSVTATSLGWAVCDVAIEAATYAPVLPFAWGRDEHDPRKYRLSIGGQQLSCIWEVGKRWGTMHGVTYDSKSAAKQASEAVEAFALRSALSETLAHRLSVDEARMVA